VLDTRNNTKNFIDINGKRYDAVTGSYLGASQLSPQKSAVQTPQGIRGGSIDGFRRVSRSTAALAPKQLQPIPVVRKPISQPVGQSATAIKAVARKAHNTGITTAPHAPQKATTLMRSAVKKPVIKSSAVIKAQTRTDLLAKVPMQTVAPKISYNSVNQVRHRRAERMIKSPAVSRYSASAAGANMSGVHSMPVTAPQIQPSNQTAQHYAFASVPAAKPTTSQQSRPQAAQYRTSQRIASQRPANIQRPSAVPLSEMAEMPKMDIFEQALADATSHEQTYESGKVKGKRGRRLFGFISASVVALFLVGFLAYQNLPSLSLQLASYRSGLHATMPASSPSGFTFGFLSYSPGNVTVNFTSPQDSRQFNITQKASSWDSQALLSNFVSSANSAYKTYSRAGRTVYLLGNNTATWVDSGVWYTVDGNSSLSTAQLLDVAGSM
jgi:hypothetical protein